MELKSIVKDRQVVMRVVCKWDTSIVAIAYIYIYIYIAWVAVVYDQVELS